MARQLPLDVDAAERERVLALIAVNAEFFHAEFPAWLTENWPIWLRFEAEASKVRRRGFQHYSARTIVHFLRHETALAQAAGELKINNNVSPDLARLYVMLHPQAFGFFGFRMMKSKAAALGVGDPVAA